MRVERRTLRERVEALRLTVTRLINRGVMTGVEGALNRRKRAQLRGLVRETQALACVARNAHVDNPHDLAWDYYEREMARLEPILEQSEAFPSSAGWSGAYELRKALEMVAGAVSRATPATMTRGAEIVALARQVRYASSNEAAQHARLVLADLLEEDGRTGEANLLREVPPAKVYREHGWDTPAVNDNKVFAALGLPEAFQRRNPRHRTRLRHWQR